MKTLTLIGMLATLVTSASCGGDELGPAAITAIQAKPLCEADCHHKIECGGPNDLAACTAKCVTELTLLKVRGDAAQSVFDCTLPLACNATDGEKACRLKVEPLAIHKQWETKCRARLATCSDLAALCEVTPSGKATGDDRGFMRFTAPETMTQLIKCLDASNCDSRRSCINQLLPTNF